MKTQKLMKTLIVIFTIIFITSTTITSAPNKDKYEKVQSYINNHMNYPESKNAEKVNGIVLVEYSVNSDGSLNLSGINASNQMLKEYVELQFSKLEITDTSFADDTSFICKYVFVDEDNLNNIDDFKLDENLIPEGNYLAEK